MNKQINTQGNGPPEIGQKHASLDNNLTCGKLKSLKELLWQAFLTLLMCSSTFQVTLLLSFLLLNLYCSKTFQQVVYTLNCTCITLIF